MTKRILQAAAVAAAVVVAVILIRMFLYGGEDAIRCLLRQLAAAAEQKNVDEVMEPFSTEFTEPDYGLNYVFLRGLVTHGFQTWDDISVTVDVREIAIQGREATVQVRVSASARSAGGGERVSVSREPGTVYLERSYGDWKIVGARAGTPETWEDLVPPELRQ